MWIVREYTKAVIALLVFGVLLWFADRYEFARVGDYVRQMEPAVAASSLHLLDQSARRVDDFRHSDIVLFSFETAEKTTMFVSRVVGLPGDRIALRDGQLFRNAERTSETYLPRPFPGIYLEEIMVARGCLYVLNDNRVYLNDSRTLGPIPWTAVYGRIRR